MSERQQVDTHATMDDGIRWNLTNLLKTGSYRFTFTLEAASTRLAYMLLRKTVPSLLVAIIIFLKDTVLFPSGQKESFATSTDA
jgi:hypothetical protein